MKGKLGKGLITKDGLIIDTLGLKGFPESYEFVKKDDKDEFVLIKYRKLPYQKRISLDEFNKIMNNRRVYMKKWEKGSGIRESDVNDLKAMMEGIVNIGLIPGTVPLNDGSGRLWWDVIQNWKSRSQSSKNIDKTSKGLEAQVKELGKGDKK